MNTMSSFALNALTARRCSTLATRDDGAATGGAKYIRNCAEQAHRGVSIAGVVPVLSGLIPASAI